MVWDKEVTIFCKVYGYTPSQVGELTLPQFIALKKGSVVFMCMEAAGSNIEPKKIEKIIDDIYKGATDKNVMDEFQYMTKAKSIWESENPGKKPNIKELYAIVERLKNEN